LRLNPGALLYALIPAKTKARLPTWITGDTVIPPDEVVEDYKPLASAEK
jgi:hypothetical protein